MVDGKQNQNKLLSTFPMILARLRTVEFTAGQVTEHRRICKFGFSILM
jgi:hypothetical protein